MARKKDESLFLRAGRGLVGLGKELARPALDYGAFVGEAVVSPFKGGRSAADRAEALANQSMKMALGTPTKAKAQGLQRLGTDIRQNVQVAERAAQPTFMTSPERRKAYSRISGNLPQSLSYGLQKTAGMASYLAPAGKSFKAASALGALGGGAVGFSQDADTFQEALGNVAGGALAGGIAGGAFYGLGRGLSKLGQRGAQSADDVAKATTPRVEGESLKRYKKTRNLKLMDGIDELNRALDDAKIDLDSTSYDDAIRLTRKKVSAYQRKINKKLVERGDTLDTDKLLSRFSARLKENKFIDNTPTNKELVNFALDEFDNVGQSFVELNKMKSRYTELANKIRLKQVAGGTLTAEDKVNKAIHEAIKDVFDDQVSTAVRNMNRKQASLYKLGDELATMFAGQTDIAVNVPLTNLKVPLGFTQEGAERLGRNVKGGIMKSVRAAGRGATTAAGALAPIASSPYARYGARQLAVSDTFRERPFDVEQYGPFDEQGLNAEGFSRDNYITNNMVDQGLLPESRREIYPQQQSPRQQGGNIQIKTAADLYAGRATRNDFVVTPDGKRIWNPYSQSYMPYDAKAFGDTGGTSGGVGTQLDALLDLHSKIPTGQIGGRYASTQRLLGSPTVAEYDALAESLAPFIAGDVLGLSPLTETEVQLVRDNVLPRRTDTPAQAKAKIDRLKIIVDQMGGE